MKDGEGRPKRVELVKPMDVKLIRHIKIRGHANPHRAKDKDYFIWRRKGRNARELPSPGRKQAVATPATKNPVTVTKLLG